MSDGGAPSPGRVHHPMYAAALQQARASGDVGQMREAAGRARREGAGDPGVQAALKELEAEIARVEGSGADAGARYRSGVFMPLYAPAIHQAAASFDEERMRALLERAEREGADDPEIRSALSELRAALSRGGTR